MPLAFRSQSHGTVAFGFFNIESDMLLLEDLFFFADQFCAAVPAMGEDGQATIVGWRLPRERIGNLHGAIAGIDLSGFIGATYERYPFPKQPERFKQSPLGQQSQDAIRTMIEPFGRAETFELRWTRDAREISLAQFRFDEEDFAELIAYVERGGYPRYANEERPEYVQTMIARLSGSVLASAI